MIERWGALVEGELLKQYESESYVPSIYHVLIATEIIGTYHTFVERGFSIDAAGLLKLQQHNFKYGYPICCSICAFMITSNDVAGKEHNALLMIMENPINTYLKVFREMIIDGKKKLIYDDYMSKFTSFGKTIQQFGIINCQKLRILN